MIHSVPEGEIPGSLPFRTGLERLVTDLRDHQPRGPFGLVMNRASIDADVRLACDVLASACPGQLTALLTPQHGLWGEQQANMVESSHGRHARLNIPVYSLYSDTRRPTAQMLNGLSALVIDLQDVGTRVYTFVWTMLYCLQECAARQLPVIVLDRPNPIGGELAEGPLLDLSCRSFVGEAGVPMRHGLTMGELALYLNQQHRIHADLTVVPLEGWTRSMWFEMLNRIWVPPSPNMPTVQTAAVYPGQVLLEGTNLSEGRGTTVPFEVVGAPFVDPDEFCELLTECRLPGVRFLPVRFTPTFDKWSGCSCGGVSIHVTDRPSFRPYRMTVSLLAVCQRRYPDAFRLTDPPYEYERVLAPLDIISGSHRLRQALRNSSVSVPDVVAAAGALDEQAWWDTVRPYLLY